MEAQKELRAWAVARCLVLLHSHELDVIKVQGLQPKNWNNVPRVALVCPSSQVAHGAKTDDEVVGQLWNYAEKTIKRFGTVKDNTKRVLGGGVANRYETRLKDVLETIETFDRSVPLGAKMLT